MEKYIHKNGFALPVIIIVIFIILGGGGYYLSTKNSKNGTEGDNQDTKKDALIMNPEETTMEEKEDATIQTETTDMVEIPRHLDFSGTIIAGNKAVPLIDFNKTDYQKALEYNRFILLYFYANWCPICKKETMDSLYPAFEELSKKTWADQGVVGFRVNYNDSDTDGDEKNLAREFGIGYQHTKVFIKDGKRILKSPESWDKERYLLEIKNAL